MMQVASPNVGRPRIEWIDLAKGFCIFLVVLHHVAGYYNTAEPLSEYFVSFRMPLYYMLSGIFFKPYDGFWGFFKRKVNKLLIPYVFFHVVLGFALPFLLYSYFDISLWGYVAHGWKGVAHLFTEKTSANHFVWFLWSLFQLNILFYCMTLIVDRVSCISKVLSYCLLSFFLGAVGLLFSYLHIDLPCFFDTTLTVAPFFYLGWLIKNKSNFLYSKSTKQNFIKSIAFIGFTIGVFAIFGAMNHCEFIRNEFGGLYDILRVYPYGVIGTISVLLFARFFTYIPILSYLGRYSIMILCTHELLMQLMAWIIRLLDLEGSLCQNNVLVVAFFNVLLLLLTYYVAIIPFMRRFMPHVTAQKDIIPV